MIQTYFIHIDSVNLPHYFAAGCLMPACYMENRPEDIQSRLNKYLGLSLRRYGVGIECSIEVELIESEVEELITTNIAEILLLDKPLPITRVRKIYFRKEETRDRIIALVNLSSGFVPRNFSVVINDREQVDYSSLQIPANQVSRDWKEKLKRFDRILGGMVLLRLAVRPGQNYTDIYFSTLSYFNRRIADEFRCDGKEIKKTYWDTFVGKSSFAILYPYLNKELTEKDVYNIAEQGNQRIIKKDLSGNIVLDRLEKGSYVIAVLYTYGVGNEGRKNKVDGLILHHFHQGLLPGKAEVISLCYGLNRRYTVFSIDIKMLRLSMN